MSTQRRNEDTGEALTGSRIVQSRTIVTIARDNGVMLLDMGAGRRVTLDGFGARVWSALESQPTLPALLTFLHADEMPAQRLAEDVSRLLARWCAAGMIAWR